MGKLVTISNDYHNTSAQVRLGSLSRSTVARVGRALCGVSDCTCGGVLGQRGRQPVEIDPSSDGTVRLWVPEERSSAAAALGARGGAAGRGESKRRDPEHYREMARRSAEARRKPTE